ncbi:alpha/beta hydrolase family protein [Kitasatospora sp. NPDC048194]|uniref:alpha/beta hydrolase family protein n=1 Tax=Kitasatospora sp. NPDC048194 TaxID=3364045 RepID=UPI00371959A1
MDTTPFTGSHGLTRRRMLGSAMALGAAAPLGLASTARAAASSARAAAPSARAESSTTRAESPAAPGSSPQRLTLPPPTGPYAVGTVALHLRDTSRPDPAAGPGRYRELMASVWYPARQADAFPLAPWLAEAPLRLFLDDVGFPLPLSVAPLTAGHVGAPVHRTGRRLPVVMYAHGAHSHRGDHTVIVQELASHGYAVITVDLPHDAFTQFPGGPATAPSQDPDVDTGVRAYLPDFRFVLDCVEALAAGRNPDADRRELPEGLLGALDPQRIGMFGWSKGGSVTAQTAVADPRVRAGLSLDGPMIPAITTDLARPFLVMTADWPRTPDSAVETFWTHLRGWRRTLRVEGAVHSSYGDNMTLIPQAGKLLGMTEQQIQEQVGTLDPRRGILIQQAYPLAFFDLHLRHRGSALFDGPSPRFPEVTYLP